jgi:hypothetical protein
MSPKQQSLMMILFKKVDMIEKPDRLQYVNEVLAEEFGPDARVESAGQLTKRQAGKVIDKLTKWADANEPQGDEH